MQQTMEETQPPPLIHVSYIRSSFVVEEPEQQPEQQVLQPTPTVDYALQSNCPLGWRVAFRPILVPVTESEESARSSSTLNEAVSDATDQILEPVSSANHSPWVHGHEMDSVQQDPHSSMDIDDPQMQGIRSSSDFTAATEGLQSVMPDATGEANDEEMTPLLNDDPSSSNWDSAIAELEHVTRKNGSMRRFYDCSSCGASYYHRFELTRHITVSHVKPYLCRFCQKQFGDKNYLRSHIATVHLKERKYKCNLCGKGLSTPGNMKVHIRTIHYGEKRHKCPLCSKAFGQRSNMMSHMHRHYFARPVFRVGNDI